MQLIKYEAARQALQEARDVDEAKQILDKVAALQAYAKQQDDQDMEKWLAEIRLRARRRIGEISKTLEKSKGGSNPKATLDTGVHSKKETLEAAGLTQKTAQRCEDVANIPEKEFEDRITECKEKGVLCTRDIVNDLVKKHKKKKERKEEITKINEQIQNNTYTLPEGIFDVICIDPPWPYEDGIKQPDYDPQGHRASNPYPEMSLDEIANIKLPTHNNCVLWLWTTHKFMRYAFDLLDNWEFQERAILTWAKDRMGLGRWLRSQSEFCIMATKGKPLINLTNQTTILHGPLREHSRKPDEFYEMVNGLCPGRKLDWFAREPRKGWEIHGIEKDKFSHE